MRILIIKTSSLGDIVHSLHALSLIRKHFPHASIDWVSEKSCASLVKAHPFIDNTWIMDTKKWRKYWWKKDSWKEWSQFRHELQQHTYDVAIDLQGNTKSGIVLSCVRANKKVGFGYPSVAEWPNLLFSTHRFSFCKTLPVRTHYQMLIASALQIPAEEKVETPLLILSEQEQKMELQIQKKENEKNFHILICPHSAWKNKQLSKRTLIDFLKKIESEMLCTYFWLWGTEAELRLVKELQAHFDHSKIMEKQTISLLQHTMQQMDLVISVDSFPLHLAATTTVPTFSIFGPSSAARYAPRGPNHHSFQGSCPYHIQFEQRCPKLRTCHTGACLKNVSSTLLCESFFVKKYG